MAHYQNSGQSLCFDPKGNSMGCLGSGQDGEVRSGAAWPGPRFKANGETVLDNLTGLVWTMQANRAGFPLTWQEALDFVAGMNREGAHGHHDWRLPNRRELFSLASFADKKPALANGHPFKEVFLSWYWSSTSAAPNQAYAWYMHAEGGRMFYGKKSQTYLVWPCRGDGNGLLAATGQRACADSAGELVDCAASGQDGQLRKGAAWPKPRFAKKGKAVLDKLTGLLWMRDADPANGALPWEKCFAFLEKLNRDHASGESRWRLPSITELESLVDASRHSPALAEDHPFFNCRDAYWSSTSSSFEPDWCMALYLAKGAVGVGQKKGEHFHLWPVADIL